MRVSSLVGCFTAENGEFAQKGFPQRSNRVLRASGFTHAFAGRFTCPIPFMPDRCDRFDRRKAR